MAIINNLNGDKVEFTGVSRFWNNTKYDFEEIYFGDKQIFSIWAELESPLPITILAAGEDLIDYRIYGNTVQTGTPTPENPIVPSGCGERTENIFDGVITQGVYNTDTGSTISSPRYVKSSKIHLDLGGYITLTFDCPKQGSTTSGAGIDGFVYLWDGDSYIGYYQAQAKGTQTIQIPEGATDFAFAIGAGFNGVLAISDISNIMLNYGSTAPTSYIPFGYKLPMVVRSNNLVDEEMSRGYFTNADFALSSGNTVYKYRSIKVRLTTGSYALRFGEDVYLVREIIDGVYSEESFTTKMYAFTCTEDGYVGFSFRNGSNTNWNENPTTVEVVQMETVPIYIGSDPLAEDEYVSYSEQKIYHIEGGTLTPTDPPVPIPALPTIQGETIIDYNPSTTPAVEPAKMYTKYRKEGF